ncbi:MAG TPA: hypothetical protein VM621_19165 [Luteibacter sp.]|uniref:hypothetical protein n=1 Tax=Luteibacter sp. TaxID=1886636 RepID=UPI002CCF60DF|nr:hypothetical protein [Luteibacter sp.]HVI57169.1 hypothetical protein [Luteibacter sp.]
MKKHAISNDLQGKLDAAMAERRANVANPVATLTPYIYVDRTVDADRLHRNLMVEATDAAGAPVGDVFIDYRVIDNNGTGSTFVLDGNPIGSSLGITEGDGGFAIAQDWLLTGKTPGRFIVRATAPESADPAVVFAEFRITISSQVPTSFRIVSRGSSSAPIGDMVKPDAVVELLDQDGEPIEFGSIQTQIHDPNDTGSLYYWSSGVVNFIQTSVEPGGTPLVGLLIPGEDNLGKTFFLRVNRTGREPHIDIPYVGVQTE